MAKRKTAAGLISNHSQETVSVRSEPDRNRELSRLAYEYWLQRGCPTGSPEVDWLRAEDELQKRRSLVPAASA